MIAREDWYADNWQITDGWVRDVESRSGLYRASALRGSNPVVANRRGALWRPKVRDVGAFTLNLWLGDTSRALVEQWWDTLLRAVNPSDRLVTYRRVLASGSERVCYGEVIQAVEPTPVGQQLIRCGLEVQVPDGVWYGRYSQANAITGAASPLILPLTNFADVTTEQHNLLYTITGPINNPTVQDVTDGLSGAWFTYDGNIAAGQTLVVNAQTWAVTGGGFTANISKLRYSAARFMVVTPARPTLTPTVQLTGTGGTTSATGLAVSGFPEYAA